MQPARLVRACVVVVSFVAVVGLAVKVPAASPPNMFGFANPTGLHRTYNVNGAVDFDNLCFQSLGTNGRSCGFVPPARRRLDDCSVARPARASTPLTAKMQVLRTNDRSNSPNADVSTVEAEQSAYSMLLTKGLIRVGIGIPANAEFALIDVDNPYGYASATELSLFRRPLPAENFTFSCHGHVGWPPDLPRPVDSFRFERPSERRHAEATRRASIHSPSPQRAAIVNFEMGSFAAQSTDNAAGVWISHGGAGGPVTLSRQPFYIGINDVLSPGFDQRAFTLFDAWRSLANSDRAPYTDAREAVARGQEILQFHAASRLQTFEA